MSKEITVHLDLFDYVDAVGEFGIADAFIPSMRELVDAQRLATRCFESSFKDCD